MINLKDQVFGRLTVIDFSHTDKNRAANWLCACECGNQITTKSNSLRRGVTTSCGCYAKERQGNINFRNLIGQKFGRLTVISIDKSKKKIHWFCKCDCKTIISVRTSSLKNEHTRSCGCLHSEICKKRALDLTNKVFGKILVISKSHQAGSRIFWNCLCLCGNKFQSRTGDLCRKKEPVRSCGCLRAESLPRGSNHPNWNSNLTSHEREVKRNLEEYPVWRKSVYERDNYTCQISGQKGGKLCAHHIQNWADNKELRFDLDNGITISEKLHKRFHQIYGNRNTTIEQLEEFKEKYNKGEIN